MSEDQEPEIKKGKITKPQFYQLCMWIGQHAEQLMKDRPSYQQAAEQASAELGFHVHAEHTLRMAMKTVSVEWVSPRKEKLDATYGRVDRLEAICEQMGRDLERVQKDMLQLLEDNQKLHIKIAGLEAEIAKHRASFWYIFRENKIKPPPDMVAPVDRLFNAVGGK